MLTEAEVELLISKALNPRDKALIALLADSGLRIGEALKLRVKDIYFDDYGAFLIAPEGKTGARRVAHSVNPLPEKLDRESSKARQG